MSDTALVEQLLAAELGGPVERVEALVAGIHAQAFVGWVSGEGYVVRLSSAPHAAESFAKDAFAGAYFASDVLPIPQVYATGRVGAREYAISAYVPGRRMDTLSAGEQRATLPSLLERLDAIGRVDVSRTAGYGHWTGDGSAPSRTWRAFLATINENHTTGYLADWHALFRESFLERELYDVVYRRMLQLAQQVPETRGLIHNDYWFINILAEGGQVRGVIDWANALYGDPLYDVARLSWGSAWPDWWYADGAALLRERYGALPDYAARLACYACHIGLDDLRYFAKAGLRAEYDFFRPRLLALLDDA